MDASSAKGALEDSTPKILSSFGLWLVNDDPAQLLVQKRLLGRIASSVHSFLSPLEALAAARAGGSSPFLITDFHMPGMDGPELAKMWCELHSDDARVLVVSASEVSRQEQALIDALPACSVRLLTSYRITELQEQAKTWFREEAGPQTDSPALPASQARLDPSILEKIGLLGGTAFVAKTVARFLQSGPEKVQSMVAAFAHRDYAKMHELAHALKGSCGVVGARTLSEAVDKIELATAPDGSRDQLEAQLRAVQLECEATVSDLEKL